MNRERLIRHLQRHKIEFEIDDVENTIALLIDGTRASTTELRRLDLEAAIYRAEDGVYGYLSRDGRPVSELVKISDA